MARTCHRAVHSMTTLVLSRETSKVFAHVACVRKTRERQFRCRVSLLSIFFSTSLSPERLKFISIKFQHYPRLCNGAAATDKRIARGAYVSMYASCLRNRFPTRFNFTPTSAQFSLHGYSPFPNARAPRD